MKRVLFICVVLFFATGCVQTRHQVMQQEKEALKLKKRLDSLPGKADASDKKTVSLSDSVRQATDVKLIESEKVKPDPARREKNPLPPPVAPLEIDIPEGSPAKNVVAQGTGVEEKTLPAEGLYEKAYTYYKKGDYNGAIIEFDAFLATYPDTDYSDNALYWKGECYYSMGQYEVAINQFEEVVKKYKSENKAPHAQLKIGYSWMELKNKQNATQAFQQVIDLYPFSDAAKIAEDKLNTL